MAGTARVRFPRSTQKVYDHIPLVYTPVTQSGQSSGLLTRWSLVQIQPGVPADEDRTMFVLVHYTGAYEPIEHYGPFNMDEEAREFAEELPGRISVFPLRKPEKSGAE